MRLAPAAECAQRGGEVVRDSAGVGVIGADGRGEADKGLALKTFGFVKLPGVGHTGGEVG